MKKKSSWTKERTERFRATMAAKKARLTVRQKSTVQAAMVIKNLYTVQVEIQVQLEHVGKCYDYMFKLQTAINDLGATVAAQGIINHMGLKNAHSVKYVDSKVEINQPSNSNIDL